MIDAVETKVIKLSEDGLDVIKHIRIKRLKIHSYLWDSKPIVYEFDKKTGVYKIHGEHGFIKEAKKELFAFVAQYLDNTIYLSLKKYEIDCDKLNNVLKEINSEYEDRFAKVQKDEDGITDVVKIVAKSQRKAAHLNEEIASYLSKFK